VINVTYGIFPNQNLRLAILGTQFVLMRSQLREQQVILLIGALAMTVSTIGATSNTSLQAITLELPNLRNLSIAERSRLTKGP
jgi:hypothetical protein